jgi:hypothetical protein
MPELDFQVIGVEAAARGLTPLLHFKLAIRNTPPQETVHSVILQVQIQIQSAQRAYSAGEKEKLLDLFGTPDRWGQTLRNKLWSIANTTVRQFTGSTEAVLPMACTYDLNIAATKYFHALEGGDVPLLFLFSGTVFYAGADGRLQAQQISWNKECVYRMPARVWHDLMEQHYPNTAWLVLQRDVFERLCAYRRRHGLPTWEQTIERLLPPEPVPAAAPVPMFVDLQDAALPVDDESQKGDQP